ncbi:MAG: DegV family protein [Christensenellales bacterium]
MLKLIVDSTAGLPEEFVKRNDIRVLNLSVRLGDKVIEEGFPEQFDGYYEEFERSSFHPASSQPSVGRIEEVFSEILDAGDEAVCILLSSALSGTFDTCGMVKSQLDHDDRITLVDSGTACQAIYFMCVDAVELIGSGATRAEVVGMLERKKSECLTAFVPESLTCLKRGGRIGLLSAALGNVLQIKPILLFKNGALSCAKKCISMQKAVRELLLDIPSKIKRICVMRTGASRFFGMLKSKVAELFPDIGIYECVASPVIGAHVGPAVGIACL